MSWSIQKRWIGSYAMKIDYDSYSFSLWEYVGYLLLGGGIYLLVDYLCYRSWWLLAGLLPAECIWLKFIKKQCVERRKKNLQHGFADALNSLLVALKAGYSMENAIAECLRDLKKIYDPKNVIVEEFSHMQQKIRMNVPADILFQNLGERSGLEDIENFARVYGSAKKSGGNLGAILQTTGRTLQEKMQVEKEVEASIAAKKMEQGLMALVPVAIVIYMRLISPGFLDVFYGNIPGVLLMTACLAIYGGAFYMGRKIVDIKV